jgi:hypothetical protein
MTIDLSNKTPEDWLCEQEEAEEEEFYEEDMWDRNGFKDQEDYWNYRLG